MKKLKVLTVALAGAMFAPVGVTVADTSIVASSEAARTYIIRFQEAGLLYYSGGLDNLAATAPSAGARKLDAKSPAALAYLAFLDQQQSEMLDRFADTLQREIVSRHRYGVTFNGVSVEVTDAEAAALRALPGVVSVEASVDYYQDTDAGPTWIGAPDVWSGTAMVNGSPNRGEGIVAGVLDGGANSDHPSYANDASCGLNAGNPKQLSAVDCSASAGGVCTGPQPEDTGTTGHGVHTASTVAGNRLVPPLNVGGVDLKWEISGVAPCAQIRHYKVCPTNSCPTADILAGISNAIMDGVDVVNFSISGGTSPWTDNDRGFLDMVNADIFVAASAGNTRTETPNPIGLVNHRGPWVMSVANATHDRIEGNPIDVAGGPTMLAAQPGSTPYTTTTMAQVAVGAALGSETGCGVTSPYAAGSMTGRIALMQRGGCNFTEKSINAQAAGAIAFVLYNNRGGPPITMAATSLPGTMLSQAAGITVRDFLLGSPNAQMTVAVPTVRVTDEDFGDVVNSGSLRGPNTTFDVTKPDITGPGTTVYAAVSDSGGQFGFLTGTSMSSPHVAGAGALVRAANPSWTPMEVKSALQLTALRDGRQDNASFAATPDVLPWTPDDAGNGRVQVDQAVRSALVMNETFANFLAANPATGGQPRDLNLPSMRHTSCPGVCTFTRTFRNTRGTAVSWAANLDHVPAGTSVQVTPASFDFTGNTAETQTVEIQVTITELAGLPELSFGHLVFEPVITQAIAGLEIPVASLSMAISGSSADNLFEDGFE